MARAWLNGQLIDAEALAIGIDERGFLLGEAAFETLRWRDGAIRRWPRHRSRLEMGLSYLGIPIPDLDEIPRAAEMLTAEAALGEAVLRLTVGGGRSPGFERSANEAATVLLTVRPRPKPPASIQLAILPGLRRAGVPSNQFKLGGYGDNTAARREARALGADMAVMCGAQGQPVCCDVANLFWVDGSGTIVTPPVSAGALPGTTRAALLEAAPGAGLEIVEASLDTARLDDALAACVTNAVMGAVPVASIDGRALDLTHPVLTALIELEKTAV